MIVVPSTGAVYLLNYLTTYLQTYYHLGVGQITLTTDTTLQDLTEASWYSYAPILVSTWSPALWLGTYAATWADPAVWTFDGSTSPVTVTYYWATDGLGGPLVWCEAAPAGGITLAQPGDVVRLYPQLTAFACPAACSSSSATP